MNTRKFGIIGEKIAQGYLINKGYEILENNYYTRRGEIDIIAKINNTISFVEVKTRNNLEYGSPAMAVNGVKKKNIKSANEYLTQTKHIPALFFTLFLRYNTNKLIGFNTGYPLANYSTNE